MKTNPNSNPNSNPKSNSNPNPNLNPNSNPGVRVRLGGLELELRLFRNINWYLQQYFWHQGNVINLGQYLISSVNLI